MNRQTRLQEVYEHVHHAHNIHTKGEFADTIGYARPYISSAMHGNERYLTDSLFKKICATFQGIFSLHYLLTGEGSLLEPSPPPPEEPPASTIDTSSLVNAALAAKDETIAALHATIATLSAQLQDRAELIATLRDNISALRRELARIAPADYPLPLAAEPDDPAPDDPAAAAPPATPDDPEAAAPSAAPAAQSPGKP